MSSPAQTIKERLSLVEVVGSYVKLDPVGSNMKGRCPFHTEKTASFFVSPARNTYHCFGCNRGGDLFQFIQDIEGVTFKEALVQLAERAGVPLESYNPSADKKKDAQQNRLRTLLEHAAVFFQQQFKEYPDAYQYLRDRGLIKESIQKFRIGFAPPAWQGVSVILEKAGYTYEEMNQAGLVIQGNRGWYDRFRSRIMFPIMDTQGRVVGFSGRFIEVPGSDAKQADAKYVNSPEGALYHKSKILYGYHEAKHAMRIDEHCVVVEGQMDLVMSHQAGVRSAVALSGTALTKDQIALIRRFTDTVVIALDADSAGQKASNRSVTLALEEDCDVKVVVLEKDSDPADIVKENPQAWRTIVDTAPRFLDVVIGSLESILDEKKRFAEARNLVYPLIRFLGGSLEKDRAFRFLARVLQVSDDAVREDFQTWEKTNTMQSSNAQQSSVKKNQTIPTRMVSLQKRFLGVVLWLERFESDTAEKYKTLYDDLMEEQGAFLNLRKELDGSLSDAIMFAEMTYTEEKMSVALNDIQAFLSAIELDILEGEFTKTLSAMREAEKHGPIPESLVTTCHTLAERINTLKALTIQSS
jgi:DNA primase